MKRNVIEAIDAYFVKNAKNIKPESFDMDDWISDCRTCACFAGHISMSEDQLLKPRKKFYEYEGGQYTINFTSYIEDQIGISSAHNLWHFLFWEGWKGIDNSLSFALKKFKILYEYGEGRVNDFYEQRYTYTDDSGFIVVGSFDYYVSIYDEVMTEDLEIECYGKLQE